MREVTKNLDFALDLQEKADAAKQEKADYQTCFSTTDLGKRGSSSFQIGVVSNLYFSLILISKEFLAEGKQYRVGLTKDFN